MPTKNSQQQLESAVRTVTVEYINKVVEEINARKNLDCSNPEAVDKLASDYGLNPDILNLKSNAKAIKNKEQGLTGISTTINKIISKETNQDIVAKLNKVQSAIPTILRLPKWLQVIIRPILFVVNKLMGASPKPSASEQDPLTKNFSTHTTEVDQQNVQSLGERKSNSCEAPNITKLIQGKENDSNNRLKSSG